MSKHTPGPWILDIPLQLYIEVYENDEYGQSWTIAKVNNANHGDKESAANARLIAAAPDLLKACKAAMRIESLWLPTSCEPEHEGECQALSMMAESFKAAIAKAEKETDDG